MVFNALRAARTRGEGGERDGEHARAAVVDAVREHAALAGAHSQHRGGLHHHRKKNSETHSHLSPSIVHDAQSDEMMRWYRMTALI